MHGALPAAGCRPPYRAELLCSVRGLAGRAGRRETRRALCRKGARRHVGPCAPSADKFRPPTVRPWVGPRMDLVLCMGWPRNWNAATGRSAYRRNCLAASADRRPPPMWAADRFIPCRPLTAHAECWAPGWLLEEREGERDRKPLSTEDLLLYNLLSRAMTQRSSRCHQVTRE